jgi:hypothetical protein
MSTLSGVSLGSVEHDPAGVHDPARLRDPASDWSRDRLERGWGDARQPARLSALPVPMPTAPVVRRTRGEWLNHAMSNPLVASKLVNGRLVALLVGLEI